MIDVYKKLEHLPIIYYLMFHWTQKRLFNEILKSTENGCYPRYYTMGNFIQSYELFLINYKNPQAFFQDLSKSGTHNWVILDK